MITLILLSTAMAAETKPCFNFENPVRESVRELLPKAKLGAADKTSSGKLPEGGVWGSARGMVGKPIAEVYRQLLDHYTIKDKTRVKLGVYDQEKPGYKDFHLVMVELHPAPMVTLNWEENWGYVVTEGSAEAPKSILISYEKTAGTKFIPKLCGQIRLSEIGPGKTEVSLYEEIDALGKRDAKDTAKGHLGTLKTLRETPRI